MKLVDMHCDTIYELLRGADGQTLFHNHLCVDMEGMRRARTMAQFFACFVDAKEWAAEGETDDEGSSPKRPCLISGGRVLTGDSWERAYARVLEMLGRLGKEQSDELRQVFSFQEIEENRRRNVVSAVATVEEGGVLNEKIERVDELYRKGVRLITLTWNYENCLAYPNSRDVRVMRGRLKPFGLEAVRRMNELGMVVDVSHLSDGGFWDCIKYGKDPIVASHSNCRALCNHPRNLTDEMLRALAEKGGVAGLNFYPAFLKAPGKGQKGKENGGKNKETREGSISLRDIARHARHMIDVAGEDVVAIGTDFDGFAAKEASGYISNVGEMELVWDAFAGEKITPRQIDKIQSKNALRVLKEVWRG